MNKVITKRHFKNGLNHEFEILDIGKLYSAKKSIMIEPHRAQFYQIIWNKQGNANHIVDFNSTKLSDNSIIFIPINSVNQFDANGKYEGKAILFTEQFFCKNKDDFKFLQTSILFSELYSTASIKFQSDISQIAILFNAMESEFNRKPDKAQYNILHNLLHIFLLQAERELNNQGFFELKPSPKLDILLRFKEMLENNYKHIKSVSKYATLMGLSEKQLNKATSDVIDKSPKQIITDRIILEAKRLLAHSTQSVKEIAYYLGFEEPTNFIKYFRKNVKVTPSAFRKNL